MSVSKKELIEMAILTLAPQLEKMPEIFKEIEKNIKSYSKELEIFNKLVKELKET